MIRAAARAKLPANHWKVTPPTVEDVLSDDWQCVGKCVHKLWPTKGPAWVATLRDAAAQHKAKGRAGLGQQATLPVPANEPPARALEPVDETPGAAAGTGDASAAKGIGAGAPGGSGTAPPRGGGGGGGGTASPKDAGAGALGGDTGCENKEVTEGDMVVFREAAGSKYKKQKGQVTKVMKKTLKVLLLNPGKKSDGKEKHFHRSLVNLVESPSASLPAGSATPVAGEGSVTPPASSAHGSQERRSASEMEEAERAAAQDDAMLAAALFSNPEDFSDD